MSNHATAGTDGADGLTGDQLDQVSGGAALVPDADGILSGTTEELMKDSLRRPVPMTDRVNQLNDAADAIQARIVDGARG